MESNSKLYHIEEKSLLCPICAKTPESQVYQCANGHMLCHQCILKVGATCPTCRVPFGEKKIRVLAVENILSEMFVNCPAEKYGCSHTMKRNDVREHNTICKFRPVSICTNLGYNGCKNYFRSGVKLIEHLQVAHGVELEDVQYLNKIHMQIKSEAFQTDKLTYTVNCIKTRLSTECANFMIIMKMGPAHFEKISHCFAILYLSNPTQSPVHKAEDFKVKIDIGIKQGDTETHIWSLTGSPLDFKAAEDENVIPYFSTSINFIKTRLDPGKGSSFELTVDVKLSYSGINQNQAHMNNVDYYSNKMDANKLQEQATDFRFM